jgi:carbonic anhydrase
MKLWHGFALSLVISNLAYADEIHWTYEGLGNPEQWGKLKPDFIMCDIGKNQTPINLVEADMIESKLALIEFSYKNAAANVVNNGHTIQVNYPEGNSIKIDGKIFNLAQFHFHTPSENQINGKSYPLEAHFVHKNDKGELAVIGIMFEIGNPNETIEAIWKKVSSKENEESKIEQELNLTNLLPEEKNYFRFNGSLTTPPCSEGVRWFVLKKPLTVSPTQIHQFKGWMKHDNARPLQPVNARPILK